MNQKRARLTPHEAIALGFELKKENLYGNSKYTISLEQEKALLKPHYQGWIDLQQKAGYKQQVTIN